MKKLILFAALVVAFTAAPFAQAVKLSNTTLNGAVTATANTVKLTSASASSGSNGGAPTVGHVIFTVDGEAMIITATNVGGVSTVFGVTRGQLGTRPALHATSQPVITGPQSAFQAVDNPPGVAPGSTCTIGNIGVQPWINLTNANIGMCVSSVWKLTNYRPMTLNSYQVYP